MFITNSFLNDIIVFYTEMTHGYGWLILTCLDNFTFMILMLRL